MREPDADEGDDGPMPKTERELRRQRAAEAQREREAAEIGKQAEKAARLALAKKHGLRPDALARDVYPFEADAGQLERMVEVGLAGDPTFLDRVDALDLKLECREPGKVRLARGEPVPRLKADHLWHLLTDESRRLFYLRYFGDGLNFLRGVLVGMDLAGVRTAELSGVVDRLERRAAELTKNAKWG